MTNRSKKEKGSRLEREWAGLLRSSGLDKNAKRMFMSGAFDDFRMKADIITDLPFHFEVKNQETWKPLEYFKQAESCCGRRMPIVIMSRNNEQIYAFLRGDALLHILKCAIAGGYSDVLLEKPSKKKKLSLDETAVLPFSKAQQLYKKEVS